MSLFGYQFGIATDTLFYLIGFFFLYFLGRQVLSKRSIPSIMFLSITVLFFFYAGYIAHKSGYTIATHHTTNMETVDLRFKNSHQAVRIPAAYLPTVRDQTGGVVQFVRIDAVLPDMKPLRLSDNKNEKDQVIISLEGGDGYDPSIRNARIKALAPYLENIPNTSLKKLTSQYFVDWRKFLVKESGFFEHDENYIFSQGDRYAEIKCEKNRNSGCWVTGSFSKQRYGYYILMDRDLIPSKWEEVDKKIVNMINGFEVKQNGN